MFSSLAHLEKGSTPRRGGSGEGIIVGVSPFWGNDARLWRGGERHPGLGEVVTGNGT